MDPSADESPSQVDSKVPGREGFEVVMHEGKYLSTYLNWSDLLKNHNKFYLVQVVQRKGQTGSGYVAHVFIRYGRVGDSGQTSFDVLDYAKAIKTYTKKTNEKKRKGYNEIKIVGEGGGNGASSKAMVKIQKDANIPDSKLSEGLQKLVNFFFDKKMMETSMVSVNVDVKKMPLGELSKETVLQGYKILRDLEQAIKNGDQRPLIELTSKFYTVIPHNFGRQNMMNFVVKTQEQVREKYDLITNLLDIQVANNILESSATSAKLTANPVDTNYGQLRCHID